MLWLENLRLQLIPYNKPSCQHNNSTVVAVWSSMLVSSYCASVWVRIVCVTVIHMSFYSDHTSSFISHLFSSVAVVVCTLDIAADLCFVQIKDHYLPQKVIDLKLKVPEFDSICHLITLSGARRA